MLKLREKIVEKAAESSSDISRDPCMLLSVPWEKAWLIFENLVLQQQIEKMQSVEKARTRKQNKVSSLKEKPWFSGNGFSTRYNKYYAKNKIL